MITEDLIIYIQGQKRKNTPEAIIQSRLENAGWHADDIEEGFRKINPPPSMVIQSIIIPKIEPVFEKIEQPVAIEPEPIVEIAKPIFATSFSEANPSQSPTASYFIPTNYPSAPKPTPTPETKISESLSLGVQPLEVKKPIPLMQYVEPVEPIVPILPFKPRPAVFIPKPVSQLDIPIHSNEELMPVLKPKISNIPIVPIDKGLSEKVQNIIPPTGKNTASLPEVTTPNQIPLTKVGLPSEPKITERPSMPANAMIYSYPEILLSASKTNAFVTSKGKGVSIKLIMGIIALLLLGAGVFAFAKGYIPLPKFSFVKKDPKSVLVSAPLVLSNLRSYKIQTNAQISLPSFVNITSGLLSGEAVQSRDKDFISLVAEGSITNKMAKISQFNYKATIANSLYQNPVITNLKYDKGTTFITVPDLKDYFDGDTPPAGVVSIGPKELNMIVGLLPDTIADKARKINIDKMLSVGVPSYIDSEIAKIFKNFINNATIAEKEPENIHGIESYHYELTSDRQSTKTFLMGFVSVFLNDLTADEKASLDGFLGSTTIDRFEVWIGQKDSMIYQYHFTLSAPLSKIIGLDDKGIAGNSVSLDWKTTYYDFNIANNITMPTKTISIKDYTKSLEDIKIKNMLSSFKIAADAFRRTTGNFGKSANPTGNCINPNPSSLFSPVGHPAGTLNAMSAISSIMNTALIATNDSLACYSTPQAWALAAPRATDPTSYFCVDSSGAETVLPANILGSTCK